MLFRSVVQRDDNILFGGDFSNVSGVGRNGVARVVGATPPTPRLAPIVLQLGMAQLTFNSRPGTTYVLEASTDLIQWTAAQTNVAVSATTQVLLPASPSGMGFYRVRMVGP